MVDRLSNTIRTLMNQRIQILRAVCRMPLVDDKAYSTTSLNESIYALPLSAIITTFITLSSIKKEERKLLHICTISITRPVLATIILLRN